MPETLGPYILEDTLGSGGMATVWSAVHQLSGQKFAVKVVEATNAQVELLREVSTTARLNHPGIVQICDFSISEHGEAFVVMERADATVSHLRRIPTWSAIRRLLFEVLDALAYAHARNVIHRDIKPANILLFLDDEGWRAKLADFGIAQAFLPGISRSESALRSHLAAGTLNYMPPEQIHGHWRNFGPWTDLYALACMVWELVTGSAPFHSDRPLQVAYRHVSEVPGDFNPKITVPMELEGWLRRALAKSPMMRFQSAAEASFSLLNMPIIQDVPDVFLDLAEEPTKLFTIFEAPDLTLEAPPKISHYDGHFDTMMGPRPVLSVPTTWKSQPPKPFPYLEGASGALLGLRQVPLTGRANERQELWDMLLAAHDGEFKVALLTGETDVGQRRIAEWLCYRAHEVGAAEVVRVAHGEESPDGLPSFLEELLGIWELDPDLIQRSLEERFSALDPSDISLVISTLQPDPQHPISQADKVLTAVRCLSILAQDKPRVVMLEDVQFATYMLEVVRRLSIDFPESRVLFVMHSRRDLRAHSEFEVRMDALEGVVTLEVAKDDADSFDEFVRMIAPINDQGVRDLREAANSNPGYVRHAISHFAESGWLVPEPGGFGFDRALPSFSEICRWRIEKLRESVPDSHFKSWVVAAVIGLLVRNEDWSATCRRLGFDVEPNVFEPLITRGMATQKIAGLQFTDREFVEQLRGQVPPEQLRTIFGTAAETALELRSELSAGQARRVASYFVAAGRTKDALEPLFLTAFRRNTYGDERSGKELLRYRQQLINDLKLPRESREQLQQDWLLAEITTGDPDDLIESQRLCREQGFELELAYTLRTRGKQMRGRDFEVAVGLLEESMALFHKLNVLPGIYASHLTLAFIALDRGFFETAIEHTEAAITLGEANPSIAWRLPLAYATLMTINIHKGDLEVCQKMAQKTLEVSRLYNSRLAEGSVHNNLGEICRMRGDFEEALVHYMESKRLDDIQGTRYSEISSLNIAVTMLALDRDEEALEYVKLSYSEHPISIIEVYVMLTTLVAALRCDKLQEHPDLLANTRHAIEKSALDDTDILWLVRKALELTPTKLPDWTDYLRSVEARILENLGENTEFHSPVV